MLHSRDDPRDDRVVVPPVRAELVAGPEELQGPPPWMEAPGNADVLVAYLESLQIADASAVAARLFSEYRSIPDILSARWVRLYRLVGPRLASVLRSTRALLERAHREQLAHAPNLAGSHQLTNFLLAHQGWLPMERLTVIYVDSWTRLIGVRTMSEGDATGAEFNIVAALRWGLELGAAGIILAHNHPSGDARPSSADRSVTNRFSRLAHELGMPLLQHVIVARGAVEFLE